MNQRRKVVIAVAGMEGALFSVLVVAHLGTAIYTLARRRAVRMTMVPTRADFRVDVPTRRPRRCLA